MNLTFILPVGFTLFSLSLFIFATKWSKKPRLHVYKSKEWLEINKNPMPLDSEYDEFLITNGEEVKKISARDIEYSRLGKPYFRKYDETLISHWSPMPAPPKVCLRLFKSHQESENLNVN